MLPFFFFNDTATTEIYTLSLHDALPISCSGAGSVRRRGLLPDHGRRRLPADRKSTRLNSSHLVISYAVFCLKKKKIRLTDTTVNIGKSGSAFDPFIRHDYIVAPSSHFAT